MLKVTIDHTGTGSMDEHAVVFVISDSLGDSAKSVVDSAAAQFSDGAMCVRRLSQIESVDDVRTYFDEHEDEFVNTAVIHSIVNPALRADVRAELAGRGITSIDVLGPVVQVLSGLTNEKPKNQASAHHMVDEHYRKRVDAMEFFMEHDNGKNSQDLPSADVVLIGLTGSAKSPLAMHLSFLGFLVASVSLDPGCEVPAELAQVDKQKLFGLKTSVDVLAEARRRAGTYDQTQEAVAELEKAQADADAIMVQYGCTVLDSSQKTVEELTNDVISQIEAE